MTGLLQANIIMTLFKLAESSAAMSSGSYIARHPANAPKVGGSGTSRLREGLDCAPNARRPPYQPSRGGGVIPRDYSRPYNSKFGGSTRVSSITVVDATKVQVEVSSWEWVRRQTSMPTGGVTSFVVTYHGCIRIRGVARRHLFYSSSPCSRCEKLILRLDPFGLDSQRKVQLF